MGESREEWNRAPRKPHHECGRDHKTGCADKSRHLHTCLPVCLTTGLPTSAPGPRTKRPTCKEALHTPAQVNGPRPVTMQHRILLIDTTHSLPFLLLAHEFQTPSSGGPFIPATHQTQLLYSMLTFPRAHGLEKLKRIFCPPGTESAGKTPSSRTSLSEVTLGPASLILTRQARLQGKFVLLLP